MSRRREYVDPPTRRRRAARDQFFSGIPACWTWPLPTEAELVAGDALLHVAVWQADRCAVCGINTPYSFVTDHDHETGLIRGYLCRSCNVYESHGNLVIFDRYRHVNPASVCRAEYLYQTIVAPLGAT